MTTNCMEGRLEKVALVGERVGEEDGNEVGPGEGEEVPGPPKKFLESTTCAIMIQ